MRLCQRIVSQGALKHGMHPPGFHLFDAEDSARRIISQSPVVIIADEIMQHCFGKVLRGIDLSELPPIAPPFVNFVIDCGAAPGDTLGKQDTLIGRAQRLDQSVSEAARTIFLKSHWPRLSGDQFASAYALLPDVGWHVILDSWWSIAHRKFGGAPVFGTRCSCLIDSFGKFCGKIATPDDGSDSPDECGSEELELYALTMAFFHCKNVSRKDDTERLNPSAKKLKRSKAWRLKFVTLKIDPFKELDDDLQPSGGALKQQALKSLHIVRGNFAEYDADAPLFGKHIGTFWRPQHLRGSALSGEVVKQYQPIDSRKA